MDETQNTLIESMLDLASARDWRDIALADIADAANVKLSAAFAIARNKSQLLDCYLASVDEAVIAEDYGFTPQQSVREKLFDIAMTRFELLHPHRLALGNILRRDGLRRAAPLLTAAQQNAALMLELAGVPSDGLIGQARSAVLAASLGQVTSQFMKDESPDLSATLSALDKSLANLEKWAAR